MPEVTVTANRDAALASDVLPYTSTGTTKQPTPTPTPTAGTLPEVTVTASKDAGIVSDVVPFSTTDVTKPSTDTKQASTDTTPVAEKPADATAQKTVKPSIYFTGVAPSPLAQGLGTSFGTTTGTTTGLTGERGAGEIESKETGKSRQNVWNEASLRLKDALGV